MQALRSVTYASSIQSNQAKIVALAPEGKLVEKGDLLILFDAAPFEEEIRRNQALLAQAEADLLKAGEDLKLQALQNTEELQAARLRVEESDLELKDVQQGKGRLKEEEAEAAVANAERELQKAEGRARGPRARSSTRASSPAPSWSGPSSSVDRAAEELALAQPPPRRPPRASAGPSSSPRPAPTPSRAARRCGSSRAPRPTGLAQKDAAIAAARSRIDEASAKLELARQQLLRCEVRADVPGIVVYKEVFFGSERRRPQVGDQVWANQPLLILPDISKMVVETKVRETDIHKVERNQKVAVRVDAYPDLRLTGAVTLVGTLAQEEKERRGDEVLRGDGPDERVRAAAAAGHDRPGRDRGRGAGAGRSTSPSRRCSRSEGRQVVYPRRAVPEPARWSSAPPMPTSSSSRRGWLRGERVLLRDPESALPGLQ